MQGVPSTDAIRVVTSGPVSGASLAWRASGALRLTVVVQATFSLRLGADMVAAPPTSLRGAASGQSALERSQRLRSELPAYLPFADATLSGVAHAPSGTRVDTLPVRFAVGRGQHMLLDKRFVVRGVPRGNESALFERVPLIYERAFGGPQHPHNPFGTGVEPHDPPPNLVDLVNPTHVACFAPLPDELPARDRLVTHTQRRTAQQSVAEIDGHFDWRYFQNAPPDQQIAHLQGNEWVLIEGLNAQHPRIQSRLPDVLAGSWLIGSRGDRQEMTMICDSLHVDAEALLCSVTWRGSLPIISEAALPTLHAIVGVSINGRPIDWSSEKVEAPGSASPMPSANVAGTVLLPTASEPAAPFDKSSLYRRGRMGGSSAPPPVTPFTRPTGAPTSTVVLESREGAALPINPMQASNPNPAGTMLVADDGAARPALPFHPGPPSSAISQRASEIPASVGGTMALIGDEPAAPSLPFPSRPTPVNPSSSEPPRPAPIPPPLSPPPPLQSQLAQAEKPALLGPTADAPVNAPHHVTPGEIDIETCAVIAAQISEHKLPRATVLASHRISESDWAEIEARWTSAIDEEERLERCALRDTYDAAFLEEWERRRGPFTVADYARLEIASSGSQLSVALESAGVRRTVWTRLRRSWKKRLANDRALAAAFEKETARLRRK